MLALLLKACCMKPLFNLCGCIVWSWPAGSLGSPPPVFGSPVPQPAAPKQDVAEEASPLQGQQKL